MKIQLIPTLLSLILAAAIGYLAFHVADVQNDANKVIVGIGTAFTILVTLSIALGAKLQNGKVAVSARSWSVFAFFIFIVANFLFAWLGVSLSLYIAVMAVLLVIHIWIVWKLSEVSDV